MNSLKILVERAFERFKLQFINSLIIFYIWLIFHFLKRIHSLALLLNIPRERYKNMIVDTIIKMSHR